MNSWEWENLYFNSCVIVLEQNYDLILTKGMIIHEQVEIFLYMLGQLASVSNTRKISSTNIMAICDFNVFYICDSMMIWGGVRTLLGSLCMHCARLDYIFHIHFQVNTCNFYRGTNIIVYMNFFNVLYCFYR